MLVRAATIFGLALVAAGILGFIPGITVDDRLLGLFHVNVAHNLVHIITGAAALYAGYTSEHAARMYFQIFGVLYGVLAIAGIFYGSEPLFGFVAHNGADIVLHFVLAALALYFGFAVKERSAVHA